MNAEQAYVFRHALIRDACYQLQLPSERARLHSLALDVLELCFTQQELDFMPHEIAAHCRAAADDEENAAKREGLLRREFRYLLLAVRAERAAFHAESALGYIERVIGHSCAAPPELAVALRESATLLSEMGRPDDAKRRFEEALAAATKLGPCDEYFRSMLAFGVHLMHTGFHDAAASMMTSALEQMPPHALALRGGAQSALAALHKATGDLDASERCAREALAIFERNRDDFHRGVVLGNLCNVIYERGDVQLAAEMCAQALELHRRSGNLRFEAMAIANLGLFKDDLGEPAEAMRCYLSAIELYRRIGSWREYGITLGNIGARHLENGDLAEARQWFVRALATHRDVGNRVSEANCLSYLAAIHEKEGDLSAALAQMQAAITLASRVGDRGYLTKYHAEMARMSMLSDSPADVAAHLEMSRASAARSKSTLLKHRFLLPLELRAAVAGGNAAAVSKAFDNLQAALADAKDAQSRNLLAWARKLAHGPQAAVFRGHLTSELSGRLHAAIG